MGCLNSDSGFSHYFGNIHLSGPCNRKCYFCIGQHMMALDSFNNLTEWPLKGLDEFISTCLAHKVAEINVTGTNTDPLLYAHTHKLKQYIQRSIPDLILGIRTNGVAVKQRMSNWQAYDKGSVTVCSFDSDVYRTMMGEGAPPDIAYLLLNASKSLRKSLKVNIVLGPENCKDGDIYKTLNRLNEFGIKRVNLREPYGQPHIGDPFAGLIVHAGRYLGMPYYNWGDDMEVTYWDVHYVEVESVNLYAQGKVSLTYPITKGHDDITGKVLDQSHFPGGRIQEQWIN
jgi:hypothetical protein